MSHGLHVCTHQDCNCSDSDHPCSEHVFTSSKNEGHREQSEMAEITLITGAVMAKIDSLFLFPGRVDFWTVLIPINPDP